MRPRLGRRLRRFSISVLVVGLVVTAGVSALTRRAVADSANRLLAEESSLEAQSMGSAADQIKSTMDGMVAVAAATGGDATAFHRLVDGPAGDLWGALALLKVTGGGFTQSVVVRPPTAAIGDPTQPVGAALMRLTPGEFAVLGFVGGGAAGRTLVMGDRSAADPQYIAYAEMPLSFATPPAPASGSQSATQASGGIPLNLDMALYVDGSESPGALVYATTKNLPLRRERAVAIISLGATTEPVAAVGSAVGGVKVPAGQFLMVTAPKGSLAGGLTANLMWISLIVGLLASLGCAAGVELVLRRRDQALHLVDELETKNAALDQALADQAVAEAQRTKLETQLRQSQRMEAIGQLAGGIAHDFNNLLAVILNYGNFAVDALDGHGAQADVQEIVGAARRAAELTRQLLVFSRQDIIHAEMLDVNEIVDGARRLLERTLGEDIDLSTTLAEALPAISADTGEIEQVLMNLAVNARDAMPAGGHLHITTGSIGVVDDQGGAYGLAPGAYVELSVADTGEGMSPEVLARVFEPFFTTKGPGKGTGMGLATVYGIVTRWGGQIRVHSEAGIGTEFKIWFPVAEAGTEVPDAAGPAAEEEPAAATPATGPGAEQAGSGDGRVVLVAEDEDAVRRAVRRILESQGYTVVDASTAADALDAARHTRVDLLLTDVIMSGGLSGKALVDALHSERPDLPVVYMSGYNADIIATRGVLEDDVMLVEKPFTAAVLLAAIEGAFGSLAGASR
jgi:signal transduction histidine kinase/ActR/RegA family two-component response regulator